MFIPMSRMTAICTLLMLFSSSAFAAAEHPTNVQYISLDEAISQTLSSNPFLLASGYQLNIKRSRVQQAGLAPNPELQLTLEDALGTGDYSGLGNAETTVSLGWVFETAVRESRVDAALANESLSTADIEIIRVEVVAETASRFLSLMEHQARIETANNAVELAETTAQSVQQRVDAGRSPQADLARAQTELAYAVLAREDIEHELNTARHRLASQWGSTQPEFALAQGNPYQLPETLSFEELTQQLEHNPRLKRYLSKQRLDEAEIRLAEAQRKPGWRGSVGIRRYESTNDFALVSGFSIPLSWRNRNQGNIAEAHAIAEQTLAESAAARVDMETTLYVFYEALQHSLHVANTLRVKVLPLIESSLAETQAAYESGRYSYFEWRSVQADLIEANKSLIAASIDAHRNVIEIERLTGTRLALEGTKP